MTRHLLTAKSSLVAAASSSTKKMELPPSAQFVVSRNGVKLPWHIINNRCEDGKYPGSVDSRDSASGSDTPVSAATLLQVLPRGAYTTCRTIYRGRRLYLFDFHVSRMDDSAQSIFGDVLDRSHAEAWSRDSIMNCVRSTIRDYRETYHQDEAGNADFRIVLLATLEENTRGESKEGVLYCHVGELPTRSDTEYIRVLIHGHGRENAEAKDSKWILDRKRLITPDSTSYEEIIMLGENGELLEGTQTNFYVVREDVLITADEGILLGSVRDSVLRVCRDNDVKVELRPPTMDDLKHASGVFISSTSRLVMPVHNVVLGDLIQQDSDTNGDHAASYHYGNCRITERIKQWVLRDVETHSTIIKI